MKMMGFLKEALAKSEGFACSFVAG